MTYSDEFHIAPWRSDLNNTSARGSREAFASFSKVGNLLTVKVIILGTIKDIFAGGEWVSIARIQEILKFWVSFATSTLQQGQDSELNAITKPPVRILFETLFYSRYGAARTEQGWPYKEFPGKIFSFGLDPPGLQNVYVI
jgi:hypothetical protein